MACPGRGKGFHPAAGSSEPPAVGKAALCSRESERLALAVLLYPGGALSPLLPINHLQ